MLCADGKTHTHINVQKKNQVRQCLSKNVGLLLKFSNYMSSMRPTSSAISWTDCIFGTQTDCISFQEKLILWKDNFRKENIACGASKLMILFIQSPSREVVSKAVMNKQFTRTINIHCVLNPKLNSQLEFRTESLNVSTCFGNTKKKKRNWF